MLSTCSPSEQVRESVSAEISAHNALVLRVVIDDATMNALFDWEAKLFAPQEIG